MPHVRKTEYKRPSEGYELRFLEVIQRHNKVSLISDTSAVRSR